MIKTLIVYELVPEDTKFFLVDGDRSDLDGCFVNSIDWDTNLPEKIGEEVGDGDKWGEPLKTPLSLTFKEGEKLRVVHCGFLL
jgi:hypothetical protein